MQRVSNLFRDTTIVVLSILVAILMSQNGLFEKILTATQGTQFIGSFLAGIFYTSLFTAAPATVVIAGLGNSTPLWELALVGGLGAVVGDMLIFRFVRIHLAEYLGSFLYRKRLTTWLFRPKWVEVCLVALGAVFVALPLPDEIGLALMGISKIRFSYFAVISWILNAGGMCLIAYIARGL